MEKIETSFKLAPYLAFGCVCGVAGLLYQKNLDRDKITQAEEHHSGIYYTPRGKNSVVSHIYVPPCPGEHTRLIEPNGPEYITVYCFDGEPATKDELADMAGVR